MKQTENLQLPILQSGDKYTMETQNEAFKKVDLHLGGLAKRVNNIVASSGESNIEIVDARRDNNTGVVYNTLGERIDSVSEQLDTIESDKADIKVELLDTLACNNTLFKLKNNANYPILQGGCLSDDGLNYYCCFITNRSGNETGIIDKYSVGNVSDFSTWKHVKTSSELNTSHGNDMTYFNNKLYLTNTNANPNEIILINPSTLNVERTIILK